MRTPRRSRRLRSTGICASENRKLVGAFERGHSDEEQGRGKARGIEPGKTEQVVEAGGSGSGSVSTHPPSRQSTRRPFASDISWRVMWAKQAELRS